MKKCKYCGREVFKRINLGIETICEWGENPNVPGEKCIQFHNCRAEDLK